jgi:pimeloyl-ACP methyl ester carboxylesterase
MSAKTVVFIHGLYMTSLCWENWVTLFEAQGYRCLAPAYPGRENKSVQELQTPGAALGKLTLSAILDHLENKIKKLDEKPILIGHSMGALITQLLLNRDLASAGIAIDSAPPSGVFTTTFSFLKANWGHITPFVNQNSPVIMSFERFQYAFVNDMPLEEQRAAFEKHVVPESRLIPRETLFGTKIDFQKLHAPLLLIAGGNDNIIPPDLNEKNYRKYKSNGSITDFKQFPGRNHFIIGQKGWEEVADYCLEWLAKQQG